MSMMSIEKVDLSRLAGGNTLEIDGCYNCYYWVKLVYQIPQGIGENL